MPLKTIVIEEKTYAELTEDGKPIYVGEDGTETGYDGEELASNLAAARGEAGKRRNELKEANEKLSAFEGIEDPEAAKEALKTVKNLEDKQLVEAGEVEKVKTEAIKVVEEKYENEIDQVYKPVMKERDDLRTALHDELIGGRFARSTFVAEKMVVPVEMVQNTFGKHFAIEDGKVVSKDDSGNPIFSKTNPGAHADFEEALEIVVNSYPDKDRILKGTDKRGTGAPGGGGGGGGGGDKTMTRAEADKLARENPAEMSKKMGEGYKVVDEAA